MGVGRPFALYVDGKFVSKVRDLERAQVVLLKMGAGLAGGQRLAWEVRLGNEVVWEGDLEASAMPEDGV
ncbi:hypothetical protein SAMD00023378_4540 [Ralstonia sp. NT80]|uniref:hypothetical protein n=1 Tax=Ralstonia sp. NT80 TaxID=1218247 RepID=UPI00066D42DB|nr:hypothetical protein [Ralstonia sp. NT80]GAQ30857.1 hypothetical protein SAMD00023378_4540 [Ralstonia sp. NT80]